VRQIWVSRINNPKLIEVPEHAVAYYRVCARHFHDMCFVTGSNNKKLQRYSLHSFAHTTKALLVNNLVSPRAIGGNCEDDGSLSYLDNLKSFLNTQVAITSTPLVLAPVYPPEETVQLPAEDNMDLATAYVSGVIGKKLRKKLPACQSCQVNLETEEDLPEHMLIRVREYAPHALVRPSVELSQAVNWTTRLFFCVATYNNNIQYKKTFFHDRE
jgi:hypothetical protein